MAKAEAKLVSSAIHATRHQMSTHADLNALGMHSGKHVALSHVSALIGEAASSLASDFVARVGIHSRQKSGV